MKIIQVTPTEFYLFKELANFLYSFKVINSLVHIEADEQKLAMLGY
jgi:hypothetical protein